MQWLRLAMLGVVAFQGLAGCALYQFRVWPDYTLLSRAVVPSGTAPEQQWVSANASLSEALAVGEALESKYESYGRTHERTVPALATILIPITATVAGLAITGTTGAPVAALSLAGGSAFVYGMALSSRERERIYAQGKTATCCLVNTYRPVRMDQADYVAFRRVLDTETIPLARAELRKAIDEFKRDVPAQATSDVVIAAEALHDGLADVHAKGLQADTLFRSGGHALVKQLTQLANEVNRALERTELDLAALKASLMSSFASDIVVTGASNAATGINKYRDAFAKIARAKPPEERASTPLDRLQEAVEAAVKAAAAVQSVLLRLGDNPLQDARECVDRAVAAVQLEPLKLTGDVTPTLIPGQTVEVTITGGVRPYTITPVGVAAKQLKTTLDDSQTAFARLKITPEAGAAPGTYSLELTDKTSSSTRVVSVTIKPAAALTVKAEPATVKQGGTLTLTISGGTPPFIAATIDSASPFSELKGDDKDPAKLVGKIKADAAVADYTVQVKSAEPLHGQVKFKVEK